MLGQRKDITLEREVYARSRIGAIQFVDYEVALNEACLCAKSDNRSFPSIWKSEDGGHYIVVKYPDREFAQDLGYKEEMSFYQLIDEGRI